MPMIKITLVMIAVMMMIVIFMKMMMMKMSYLKGAVSWEIDGRYHDFWPKFTKFKL